MSIALHPVRLASLCAVLLATLLAASAVPAAEIYWDGLESGDWNDADNWSSNRYRLVPGSVPGASDDVIMDWSNSTTPTGTSTLSANQSANSITVIGGTRTIGSGNSITVGGGGLSLLGGTSTFNNDFIVGSATQTWLNQSGAGQTFGGNVDLNGNALTLGSRNSMTFTGNFTGAGSLSVLGAGFNGGTATIRMNTAATYTGDTTINSALANLDFVNMGTPTDMINSGSKLVLGGGGLTLTAKNNVASSQTFNNTELNAGANRVIATPTGTGTMTVNLGAITRNAGSAVNFSSTGSINTSTANNAAGILGGYATFGATPANVTTDVTWARNNGANVIATTAGTAINSEALLAGATSTTNANITASITLAASLKNYVVSTLRYDGNFNINGNSVAGTTITIGSGGILGSDGATGSNGNDASLGPDAASTSGNVTVTSSTGSLVVHMYGSANFGLKYALTGNMDLIRTGHGGQLRLKNNVAAANNFLGTIYVYQGNLFTEQGDTVFGNAANDFVVDSGGSINFSAAVGANRDFTIGSGGGSLSFGNNTNTFGANRFTINGPLTITSGNNSQTFGAFAAGSSGGDIILSNTGTAAVVAGSSSAFGAKFPIVFQSNANTKTLRLNGFSVTVGGLSTGATVGTSVVESNSGTAGTDTLTVNRSTTNETYGGILRNGSTRLLALTKTGLSTLTLTGDNSYTGSTNITGGGTLALSGTGDINSTSGITIGGASTGGRFITTSSVAVTQPIAFGAAGGTIGGTGTINSAVTIGTNARIAPGTSPGAQSYAGGITLAGGGVYEWEITNVAGTAGSQWDLLNVSGGSGIDITATSGTPFTIDVTALTAVTGLTPVTNSWLIADATTDITTFAADKFAITLTGTGFNPVYTAGSFSVVRGDNILITGGDASQLYLVAVPEPGTFALAGLGLLLLVPAIRRRMA